MTAGKNTVKEALSRFSGQRRILSPATHDFSRGIEDRHHHNQATHEFIHGRTNALGLPIIPHEFIRGRTNPRRQFQATHEFIRGNQETNVKICSFPRFQSWETRKITISYTPIPAILMNECTEYDYIMFTNEFPDGSGRAVDCGFPRFIYLPTNEFVGWDYSSSLIIPTNEFVGWGIAPIIIFPMNEFMGYAPLAVYKFVVSEN